MTHHAMFETFARVMTAFDSPCVLVPSFPNMDETGKPYNSCNVLLGNFIIAKFQKPRTTPSGRKVTEA